MLRKIFAFILIVAVIICGGVAYIGIKESVELSFAVLSDVHVYAKELIDTENYETHATRDKMEHLSEAILESAADEIIASELDFVLVSGDLSNNGDFASLEAAARIFKKIEDGGKEVFIINGNHDVSESYFSGEVPTREQFIEIFKPFGYDKALNIDKASRSYVADLDKEYRLIAIDDCPEYFEDGSFRPQLTDELFLWTEEQLKQCEKDGKKPIAMAHIPLLNHWPELLASVAGHDTSKKSIALLTLLADYGVKALYTGHNHGQDVTAYTTEKGNVIYDIQTAATVVYPSCYRRVTMDGKGYDLTTTYISAINEEYLDSSTPEEDRKEIRASYRNYVEKHLENGMYNVLRNVLSPSYLVDILGLQGEAREAFTLIMNEVVNKVLNMPLYKHQADDGQASLESILAEYSVSLPLSSYSTLMETGVGLLKGINFGDENLETDSVELEILKYSILNIFFMLSEENTQSALQTLYPDIPPLTFDGNDVFKNEKVNVIDSGLIATATYLLSQFGILPESLKGQTFENTALIKILVRSFLGEGYDVYFSGTQDIKLGALIEEQVFGKLVAVFIKDVPPSDNFLFIEI